MISPLSDWVNFNVIVGSSAGALTGLQFVVITLISEGRTPGSMQEIRAFGTPTVVHFCVALLLSALMSAPWKAMAPLGWSIAACGAFGVVYSLWVLRHAKKANYEPDGEDWFWYVAMPLVAYAVLLTAAALLWRFPNGSLFGVAATSMLFLFMGIRNSWDTVTYIAVQRKQTARREQPGKNGP